MSLTSLIKLVKVAKRVAPTVRSIKNVVRQQVKWVAPPQNFAEDRVSSCPLDILRKFRYRVYTAILKKIHQFNQAIINVCWRADKLRKCAYATGKYVWISTTLSLSLVMGYVREKFFFPTKVPNLAQRLVPTVYGVILTLLQIVTKLLSAMVRLMTFRRSGRWVFIKYRLPKLK